MSIEIQLAQNIIKLLKEKPQYQRMFLNARFQEIAIHELELDEAQSILDEAIKLALEKKEVTEKQAEILKISIKNSPTIKGMLDRIDLLGRGIAMNTLFGGNEQLFAAVTPKDSIIPSPTGAFEDMQTVAKEIKGDDVLSNEDPLKNHVGDIYYKEVEEEITKKLAKEKAKEKRKKLDKTIKKNRLAKKIKKTKKEDK